MSAPTGKYNFPLFYKIMTDRPTDTPTDDRRTDGPLIFRLKSNGDIHRVIEGKMPLYAGPKFGKK